MSPPTEAARSTENKILAALSSSESQRLFSQMERDPLAQGKVIYEPGAGIEHVYFPETAIFSTLATMADGSTVEVGPVGDEGMVGLRVFLGADREFNKVVVHVAGSAMRMRADALRGELRISKSPLPALLMRYTQMLLAMTGQTSACYKLHPIEQQLARWLSMMHDYIGRDELLMTQDLIALTLGVRRAGVTHAAIGLKGAGIIEYHRGRIRVLDPEGLRAKACECYREIKDEYDLLYADLPRLAK